MAQTPPPPYGMARGLGPRDFPQRGPPMNARLGGGPFRPPIAGGRFAGGRFSPRGGRVGPHPPGPFRPPIGAGEVAGRHFPPGSMPGRAPFAPPRAPPAPPLSPGIGAGLGVPPGAGRGPVPVQVPGRGPGMVTGGPRPGLGLAHGPGSVPGPIAAAPAPGAPGAPGSQAASGHVINFGPGPRPPPGGVGGRGQRGFLGRGGPGGRITPSPSMQGRGRQLMAGRLSLMQGPPPPPPPPGMRGVPPPPPKPLSMQVPPPPAGFPSQQQQMALTAAGRGAPPPPKTPGRGAPPPMTTAGRGGRLPTSPGRGAPPLTAQGRGAPPPPHVAPTRAPPPPPSLPPFSGIPLSTPPVRHVPPPPMSRPPLSHQHNLFQEHTQNAQPRNQVLPPSQQPVQIPTRPQGASVVTPVVSTLTPPTVSQNISQPAAKDVPSQTAPSVVGKTLTQNPAPPFTEEQIGSAWSEHNAPNGIKYYYNSVTKQSTYSKPEELIKKEKLRTWIEYTDPNTGKNYYSDGVTTTWETPEGYQSKTETEEETPPEPAKKKRRPVTEKETEFNNREEAIAAFKGLLLSKGVSPTLKWNEVVKTCSSDSRWDDCEVVLTTGERKQALAEYQTKRANELRVLERQERARAKDAFVQLLTETLPNSSNFSVWNSRFSDIRSIVAKDDRFYAVQEEETRESLFLDFCEELRKRDERKKRNKKREAQEAFLSFLKEKEELGKISFASTWNTVVSSLESNEKSDPRFAVSSTMTDSDRQLYFADFVIELQAAEDDKRRRIRDARRRAEKAQREAYRDTLTRIAAEENISISSRWRNVEELISVEESFIPVQEQDRDAPRELFEEFMDEWNDAYRRDRLFLSQLVHPSSNREIIVKSDTTYDEFIKALLDEAASSQQYGVARCIINRDEPISSARLYFNELSARAQEKDSGSPRRRGMSMRRNDSSSEDEGEIIEDEGGLDKRNSQEGNTNTDGSNNALQRDNERLNTPESSPRAMATDTGMLEASSIS